MKHPASWQQTGNGYVIKTLFNENISITDAATWPVFVSLSEAKAYARWKGRRIMTEPEWCRIAYTSPNDDDDEVRKYPWGNDEPTSEHGNFNWTNLAPTPVGSHPLGTSAWGVQDLIGDAWEWTSSVFAPFDGFEVYNVLYLYFFYLLSFRLWISILAIRLIFFLATITSVLITC